MTRPGPIVRPAPIIIVAPPCSGQSVLAEALAPAALDRTGVLDDLLHPTPAWLQQWGDVATEDHPALDRAAARAALLGDPSDPEEQHDREGWGPERPVLLAGPADALRIRLLADLAPGARFVHLYRAPARAVPEAMRAWLAPDFPRRPSPPGWEGPAWTFPLVPEWRQVPTGPVAVVAREQWARTARVLLDDLAGVPREQVHRVRVEDLVADPEAETRRLCRELGLGWHPRMVASLEESLQPFSEARLPEPAEDALDLVASLADLTTELEESVPVMVGPVDRTPSGHMAVVDSGLGAVLHRLNLSLLATTYQSDRVLGLGTVEGRLEVSARRFERPMGVAVSDRGFALGTRSAVLNYVHHPMLAQQLREQHDPAAERGPDAAYLPRSSHVTGDVAVHEMAFGTSGLWLVATSFSALATLDAFHSFVPRWTPPFISAVAPEDRCHLNGLALRDGLPAWVTALGVSDEPHGWRAGRASEGVLLEVPSGRVVVGDLSMPHSPRWAQERLWVLESGRGRLLEVDPDSGASRVVVELPGFTRGMTIHQGIAFVGTSQVRETATFGGLPVTDTGADLTCGIWAVELATGAVCGSVSFADHVEELFEVAVLAGVREPWVAELDDPVVRGSWAIPATE